MDYIKKLKICITIQLESSHKNGFLEHEPNTFPVHSNSIHILSKQGSITPERRMSPRSNLISLLNSHTLKTYLLSIVFRISALPKALISQIASNISCSFTVRNTFISTDFIFKWVLFVFALDNFALVISVLPLQYNKPCAIKITSAWELPNIFWFLHVSLYKF